MRVAAMPTVCRGPKDWPERWRLWPMTSSLDDVGHAGILVDVNAAWVLENVVTRCQW